MSGETVFGIKITGSGSEAAAAVRAPREELDRLEASAKNADAAAGKLNVSFTQGGGAAAAHAKATKDSAEQVAKLDAELEALLGKLDPAQRAVNQLNDAQGLLTRSMQAGLLSQKQYNDALQAAKGLYGGEQFEKLAAGADKSAFATAGARRELIVLGHEAMTGNFSRMPGSVMVLAERMGGLGGLISPVTAGIVALGAAVLIMAAAMHGGAAEMKEMNNALAVTHSYAGMTRTSMVDLATQMSATAEITIGKSKAIVTALVESGRIGSESIGAIARLSADYAAATGKDIAKLGPDLVKLFEDPAKGAKILNDQMHFLSPTQIEHITHLQRIGELGQAQLELAKLTAAAIPKVSDNLGTLEKAWMAVRKAGSDAWDAMLGIGRQQTMTEQITKAKADLAKLSADSAPTKFASGSVGDDTGGGAATLRSVAASRRQATVDALQLQISNLERQAAADAKLAAAAAGAGKANQVANQSADLINSVSQYARIAKLNDDITLAKKGTVTTSEEQLKKDNAIYDLNKQLYEVTRSIGADGRAIALARIAGAENLAGLENKNYEAALQQQLKLGGITEAQFDERMKAAELYGVQLKETAERQRLAYASAYGAERENINQKLKALDVERAGIETKYRGLDLVREEARLRAQADADAKASGATVTDQLKAIEALQNENNKLRERNLEIGKTKAQVDALKAAELDRAVKKLEYDRSINDESVTYMQDQSSLGETEKALFASRLTSALAYEERLNTQIKLLRDQQGLQRDGSALQAAADAEKKMMQDALHEARQLETALTNSLMNAFTAGGSFAKTFVTGIEALFKTMVLRPIINAIVAPVSMPLSAVGTGLGNSIASSLGINTATSVAGAGIFSSGTAYGAVVPGLSMGGGQAAMLASQTGAFGAEGLAMTAAAGATATGAASAGIMAGLASIGPIGWAAIAAGALLGGGLLFGGGGGPKPSTLNLVRNATGDYGIGNENIAGGPDSAALKAMEARLNDASQFDPAKVDAMAGQTFSTGGPADTATLLNQMAQALAPAAQSAKDLAAAATTLTGADKAAAQAATALSAADTAAAQAAAALAAQKRGLEIQLMQAQGDAAGALAAQRADALAALDPSLRAIQEQIYAAQDLAAASAEAAKAQQAAAQAEQQRAQALTAAQGVLQQAYQTQAAALQTTITQWQNASAALRAYSVTLAGSTASPAVAYQLAAQQFSSVSAQARLGDLAAIGKLQTVGETFRAASLATSATQTDYLRDVSTIQAAVTDTADLADRQASIAQQQLDALTASVSALVTINQSVISVQQAIDSLALLNVPGHATGLARVPYDGYLMTAHAGEAVLTAPEAAAWRAGGPGPGGGASNDAVVAAIDRLAAKVEAGDIQIAINTGQVARLFRKFDVDGMPVTSPDRVTPILVRQTA